MWRWDQGRLLYLQFDILKSIARVLTKYNSLDIFKYDPAFRASLMSATGMSFAPSSYTVLRNYKRVFECAFLATVADKHLVVTDFCREIANSNGAMGNVDEFLLSYISRFRFPFPAFDGYDHLQERVYPFCAVIKYLISRYQKGIEASATVDDIFHTIIANKCNGSENISFYNNLTPININIPETERRQLREMLIFISQLSILKVYDKKLWLDIDNPAVINDLLQQFLAPIGTLPKQNRNDEFFDLTKINSNIIIPTIDAFISSSTDLEFIEGKRKRVEHFRIDRSPMLRKYFRAQNVRPICDMCSVDVSLKYPWTDYMLEIHHLLPLASSLAITMQGTSLKDIVGLCPSCHRSIHMRYTQWLKHNKQDDFHSRDEAIEVYLSAKEEIA
ncbi:MAG: HNH endonuclease [Defluviitaleaceae bacterium]|nr:HNH endonuclease [Defluviitaleaceae bacterium]